MDPYVVIVTPLCQSRVQHERLLRLVIALAPKEDEPRTSGGVTPTKRPRPQNGTASRRKLRARSTPIDSSGGDKPVATPQVSQPPLWFAYADLLSAPPRPPPTEAVEVKTEAVPDDAQFTAGDNFKTEK